MWTYMMAAARGDRANSMMSSRRRNETESPKYGYNLTRPMYRTTRLHASSNTAYATAQYGGHSGAGSTSAHSSGSGAQMFHTYAAQQQRLSSGGGSAAAEAALEDDGGTSLFSPLTPSATMTAADKDSSLFNCKDTAVRLVRKKHFMANHIGSGGAGGGSGGCSNSAAVVRLHDTDGEADDDDDDDEEVAKLSWAEEGRHRGGFGIRRNRRSRYEEDDIDEDDNDDSYGYEDVEEEAEEEELEPELLESVMENGKRRAQDQTNRTKPSTLRRTLNALRQRLTNRNRAKPPDWFLEKFSNNTSTNDKIGNFTTSRTAAAASTETGGTTAAPTTTTTNASGSSADGALASEIRGSSILCNRLSVNPSLQSHYRWLSIVFVAVLYNILVVVGRAVFWELNHSVTLVWCVLDYLCDIIYLVDTLVHMHEGYLDQGLLVRDAYKLRRHYFSTKGWIVDVLSMLPTDLAYIWWSPSACSSTFLPCAVIVRLNRLLRLPRMWEWFDRTETATGYPNAFRICKVVVAILVLIHWNACMYFAISYALGFGTDNWVYNLNGYPNNTLHRQYIYSFYWSTLTLTTIGETPTPENDAEYLFVVADFLAGVLIFATIVGNIGSMISNMNVARVEFQNRMDGVKQYMAFRRVGHELEARVIRWFAYTWSQSGALDEERVLAALPDKLKAEIAIQVHMDTLKQVRIFHDCEPGLLEALVLKLKLQVFSPGDYICRKGDVGKEMYIVKRGKLSVVANDGLTVFATLGAGSVFGEVSVLEIAGNRTGNRRTANVRSLGYSDLFCLAKRDLWETLGDYPEARATLTERGCQLLRKDGLLDEEIFSDSQRVHDSIEGGIEKLEVSVENLNVRLARLLAEYTASQAKMKQRLAKLELSNQLTHSSVAVLAAEPPQTRPPRSSRLYSLQPKKRPRPRPVSASKSNDSKQNTL